MTGSFFSILPLFISVSFACFRNCILEHYLLGDNLLTWPEADADHIEISENQWFGVFQIV